MEEGRGLDGGGALKSESHSHAPPDRGAWVAGTVAAVAILVATAAVLRLQGQPWWCACGSWSPWSWNVWSSHNSQHVMDPYSFSHVLHGLLFYALLVRLGVRPATRFALALGIEAGWEVLENSPVIIDRYRSATIALGYEGDSILNSTSDILMMSLGFLMASRLRWWLSAAALVAIELGCLAWVRDNLTLNIVMLVHPIEAIKAWQMAGAPAPLR